MALTRNTKVVLPLGALAVLAASVLGWLAVTAGRAVDSRYVHQEQYALDRRDAATQRMLDSAAHVTFEMKILEKISSLDSSDRCRRNLKQYCR